MVDPSDVPEYDFDNDLHNPRVPTTVNGWEQHNPIVQSPDRYGIIGGGDPNPYSWPSQGVDWRGYFLDLPPNASLTSQAVVRVRSHGGAYDHRWTVDLQYRAGGRRETEVLSTHKQTRPDEVLDGQLINRQRAIEAAIEWMEDNPAATREEAEERAEKRSTSAEESDRDLGFGQATFGSSDDAETEGERAVREAIESADSYEWEPESRQASFGDPDEGLTEGERKVREAIEGADEYDPPDPPGAGREWEGAQEKADADADYYAIHFLAGVSVGTTNRLLNEFGDAKRLIYWAKNRPSKLRRLNGVGDRTVNNIAGLDREDVLTHAEYTAREEEREQERTRVRRPEKGLDEFGVFEAEGGGRREFEPERPDYNYESSGWDPISKPDYDYEVERLVDVGLPRSDAQTVLLHFPTVEHAVMGTREGTDAVTSLFLLPGTQSTVGSYVLDAAATGWHLSTPTDSNDIWEDSFDRDHRLTRAYDPETARWSLVHEDRNTGETETLATGLSKRLVDERAAEARKRFNPDFDWESDNS